MCKHMSVQNFAFHHPLTVAARAGSAWTERYNRRRSLRPEAILPFDVPPVSVTRTYLRLAAPSAARPRRLDDRRLTLERLDPCPAALYRDLYRAVGGDWQWRDRDAWTDERLARHLGDPDVHVFVLRRAGELAGYFELVRHEDGDVEIAYFGLVPRFIGQGLGAHLLSEAVDTAWQLDATSVWLHTCTLDHPAALANYRARGFEPYRTETYETTVP